jgi:hypothetical protein
MKAESCREWRESLGAYALGQLSEEERIRLEAHLEGCPSCSAEIEQLAALRHPMSLADPARFDTAPALPSALAARVAAAIGRERLSRRRRRTGFGFAMAGATAAVAAALAIFVFSGSTQEGPGQHVSFASTPKGVKISAKLIPNPFGTEIHMYVKGVDSGTLCRVYLKSRDGTELSAGTFRYRWGDDSFPILSSALDLSKTEALEVKVGGRTYVAKLASSGSEDGSNPGQEERQ